MAGAGSSGAHASAKERIDGALVAGLHRWTALIRPRAARVCAAVLAATVPLAVYAAFSLGVNVETLRVLHPELPSRVALENFGKIFPILNETVIVVIDGTTSEQARDAILELEKALAKDPDFYTNVYVPGGGAFFERNGLLYSSVEELDDFAGQLATAQPLIAELERNPSLASLVDLVEEGLDERAPDGSDDAQWSRVLERVAYAARSVDEAHPVPVSWEDLLLGDSGNTRRGSTRRLLLTEMAIDPNSLFDAGRAGDDLRRLASELGFGPERGVRMRLTGNPMLNYEEIIGLLWDIGAGSIFCLVFVVLVLQRALRSFRMVIAGVVTLLVGLIWTAAFAAAAVGHLNVISLAFAILFIGLGVDFTIHLGMHYAAARSAGADDAAAMVEALSDVGSSLVICTITTAIGFYVFLPTYYSGVAELGLIAGTGMFVVLFLTVTFFPALLASWLAGPAPEVSEQSFGLSGFDVFVRRAAAVRWGALALGIAAVATFPFASFDANNVLMRDASTESVETFDELLAGEDEQSPYFANALVADFATARELAKRFEALDAVSVALTLEDFVPEEQEEKREILADLAFILEPTQAEPGSATSNSGERAALAELANVMRLRRTQDTGLSASMGELEAVVRAFLAAPDPDYARLAKLKALLLDPLPAHIARLRTALEPDEVTLASLPKDLSERMVARDGRVRIQIYPEYDLREKNALGHFVRAVREVDPEVTGFAVNLVGFGDAIVVSFIQALTLAVVLISTLLLLLWRRLREALLALAPLLLGAALTVAGMVLLGLSFNFVNVIVIPLLLGIGVDSSVHLVHRASTLEGRSDEILASTTARAVLFSALTTITSFGALALSSHRGMSSLGVLLMVGLAWMLVSNLIVLPALVERFPPGKAAKR